MWVKVAVGVTIRDGGLDLTLRQKKNHSVTVGTNS